jgi:hypothetical protein
MPTAAPSTRRRLNKLQLVALEAADDAGQFAGSPTTRKAAFRHAWRARPAMLVTARSEALTMSRSTPTPKIVLPSGSPAST